ncbi:probable serine protease DO-like protein [Pedobacter sp. BAL39]|uniref:trypsin-like peptidase domain-containing protein n=1 Tax=Pedobacter sp. BAL39 TaxID=391596 RepID=UPI00015596CC|nr:trypsin-like peptidase domain-containing protein [Pedobacter sp. BAL39]EDM37693.1 probable serine protease DO-like protein [Pedobacter sp. BAL39]
MSKLKHICAIAIFLVAHQFTSFAQQLGDAGKLEKVISKAIDRAYLSSVHISPYDTVRKGVTNSVFSGVVVSAEGHILTVAHTAKPNEIYQVTFPDGAQHLAVGLGRMAIKSAEGNLDMAMLKIQKPGKWHFAEIGSNANMKPGQACISISYPGTFNKKTPNIRFGKLSDINFDGGFFISTCKMEPGDSGGPLFDAEGKLIGIHSWIEPAEARNFEVPVELYVRYWSALNDSTNYQELPEADMARPKPTRAKAIIVPDWKDITGLAKIGGPAVLLTGRESTREEADTAVSIEKAPFIRGTVIKYVSDARNFTGIISKNSEISAAPAMIVDGRKIALKILKRDIANDLVLLGTDVKLAHALLLTDEIRPIELDYKNLGNILVSPLDTTLRYGVLSHAYTDMPLRFSSGFFGANATFINQRITITDIAKGSAAQQSLKLKDQVMAINGIPVSQPADYGRELMKYMAGDSISLDVIRDASPLHVNMFLPERPPMHHAATQFAGGRSTRSDGFRKVFVQDATIKSEECGGPVFDRTGRFMGINIARHSRTSTIVMPTEVIVDFVKNSLQKPEGA